MRWKSVLSATIILGLLFAAAARASAEQTVVSCGPGQHAVVRTAYSGGESVTRVTCANGSSSGYRPAAYRTQYVTQERVVRRNRSLAKSALIIGGSAASGAGVGGLLHGKKGALIGSALAGGAASIYEGARRR